MRYFIAKNGTTVVEKQVMGGDDAKIDSLVDQYKTNHPSLVVSEVDQPTFDATVYTPVLTPAQKDWAAFKTQLPQPTALQGILYLAKYLGLE